MRVVIVAVGRLRAGPERALVDDYLGRFDRTGRRLGLGPAREHEIEARGGASEPALLARAVPDGAALAVLDERGRALSSPEFGALLGRWRDEGRGEAAFVIGGAEGLGAELPARADAVISLGPMVWPHLLVRAMLAEQLYRAATILAGLPYHRA